jgi:gas vesicle structural protein
MAVQTSAGGGGGGALDRPSGAGLAEVVDTILDKGLVIDAYVRVSLVGIELLTVDARVVVASVDTYLRFAEAANRLDLAQSGNSKGLPEVLGGAQENGAHKKVKGAARGAIEAAGESVRNVMGDGDGSRHRKQRSREEERDGASEEE